jgi:predicted tellurium resistance membrane protein TerC
MELFMKLGSFDITFLEIVLGIDNIIFLSR